MWPFKKKEKEEEAPKVPEKGLTPRQLLEKSQRESHPEYYARRKELKTRVAARRP